MKKSIVPVKGRLFLLASALLFLTSFTTDTYSLQDKWVSLGERTVNHTIDHSEITFDAIGQNLNALRVKSMKGAINLHRCVVYYKAGSTNEITILNSIPERGESKVIELPDAGEIVKVVLTYDTKNRATQKAVVQLWGRQ
ncbi:MAG TPA: hypothetical protein VGD17_11590 [Chitinophagaceae bacterium]